MTLKRPRTRRRTELPSETFRGQVASTRKAKGLSQRQLAEHLTDLGLKTDQTTVAKLESGARGVSLDELFVYAAALEVAPVNLAVPREDDCDVAVAGRLKFRSDEVRSWFVGRRPLRGQDERFFLAQVAEEEWRLNQAPDAVHLRMVVGPLVRARAMRDHMAARRALARVERALGAVRDEIEADEAEDEEGRG